jgi:DHA2 family methylenomycin A resistance protein-like MFS transporter
LIAVALPLVVLSIDFSGVAVALPDIGRELDVPASSTGWVINAFALGAAGPLLVSGRAADLYGRKRMLVIGVLVFSVGTLLAATAPVFNVLIIARVIQGFATALFMTASLSVVSTSFTGDRRAWGIGMWSAIGSTAAAAAPVVGGLLVATLGWRWFFALNLPVLLAALLMILRYVPESFGDKRPIDLVGALLATASVTCVIYGLQEAGMKGWQSPWVLGPLAFSVALFGVFVLQQRFSAQPLIAAAIVHARAYRPPVAVAFLANWGFGAINILMTFWLQDVRNLSAAMTGIVFLAYSVPFAIMGALTGRVVKFAGMRAPMILGMFLIAVSFVALTQLGTSSKIGLVIVAMALSGVGQGLAYNVSTTAAMTAVPDDDAGVASGLLTSLRNVGVAAGVAIASMAVSVPSSSSTTTQEQEFTAGIQRASWVIVLVSLLGMGIAAAASSEGRAPAAPADAPTPAS